MDSTALKPDRWSLRTPRGTDFRASYRARYPWHTWIAAASGPVTALIGLLGLAGWFLDIPLLKSPLSSWITMKANTAVALTVLGTALFILQRGVYPRIAAAMLAFVCVVSALSLLQYTSFHSIDIDQILVNDPGGPGTIYPGRMAASTAFALILISLGGFAAIVRRYTTAQTLFLFALLIGVFYVQVLLFHGHSVLELHGHTNMAFNTAMAVCVSAAGGLCMWPDVRPMRRLFTDSLAGFVLRRLVPLALLLPLGLGLLRLEGELAGWYDLGFGVALVSTANVVVLILLLWKSASIIDRTDASRQANEHAVVEAEEFARAAINSLSAHIAIVNRTGMVEAVNNRWPELAQLLGEHGLHIQPGSNYIEACRQHRNGETAQEQDFAAGLEAVLNRARPHYSMEYALRQNGQQKWLQAKVRPFYLRDAIFAIVAHEDVTEMRQTQEELELAYGALEKARAQDLEFAELEIIERLASAAEFRDDETAKHTARVGELSAALARQLNMTDDEVTLMRRAAPLHDVGKIAIPDSILHKPGKLTPEEYAQMQTHAAIGARLLGSSQFPLVQLAALIARAHHEKWDGTGYPLGLSGEKIPLPGRIVAVVDVFDALISKRPYKQPWTHEKALEEIELQAGKQFDPTVVKAFLSITATESSIPS